AAATRRGFMRPWHCSPPESLAMRALVAFCIFRWMPSFRSAGFPVEKSPEGLARWIDTTWLADNAWFRVVIACVWAGTALYLLGGILPWLRRGGRPIRDLLTPVGLTLVTAGICLVQSNRNSQ